MAKISMHITLHIYYKYLIYININGTISNIIRKIFDARYNCHFSDNDKADEAQKQYAYRDSRPSGMFANVKSAFVAESISSFHIIANITRAAGGSASVNLYARVCVCRE